MQYLLPILLIIPLIGAIGGSLLPHTFTGKWWGIVVSIATAIVGGIIAFNYDWAAGGVQFAYEGAVFERLNSGIRLGVDSISIWLVLMTCVLHPLATTASFRSIRKRTKEHYAWFNLILFAMIGAFIARDGLLFYAFFEFSLVPLFFIVGIWGGPDRKQAAAKLFIYTFAGGVFTLMAILYTGLQAHSFDMTAMITHAQTAMTSTERFWVLLGLLAGFGVKTPIFPLHTWLPLAHTEAPTAGSVDLAALVLKLGTYGLVRLALPIGLVGPNGTVLFPVVLNVLATLCVIGVIYGALVAWAQTDIKRLIAYSSVSHLGFCVLGMLALNQVGVQASVFYMVNHGINTGALFLIIGMIYNRYHTRDVRELSGLGKAMPKMAFFMVLFIMASVGLPGTNGFIGEFLTLLGAFTSDHLHRGYAIVATIGVVLGAVYLLKLSGSILFGPLNYPPLPENAEDGHRTVHPKYVTGGDITGREVLVLTPLAILSIGLGVMPSFMLQSMVNPVREILAGQPTTTQNVAMVVEK
ncbi:MAG TPA: NADH-quinone oxidoreductase subunit M [Tepidisphaeraceae bacterium]|jgi:NADH-quinone oxidoreductase subunit M|nr:NADH-quinone oxidoreductase subunit M [Tepidisphaeraceae bacterium]